MGFMPFHILGIWFRGLLALAIPVVALCLLKWWYDDSQVVERAEVVPVVAEPVRREPEGRVAVPAPDPAPADRLIAVPARNEPQAAPRQAEVAAPAHRVFRFDPGWNRATAELVAGIVL